MSDSSKNLSSRILESIPENNRIERIWKLAQIDFKRRYYNDRLGLLWALINPLFQIAIYYTVFTQIFESSEEYYVLFLFSGLLLWQVFAEISNSGTTILQSKLYLIENIQFDKVDLFISQGLSVVMAFLINISIYFLLALINGVQFSGNIIYFLPVLFSMLLISVSMALVLCTIYLYLDDIKHLWDMILFLGFWTSGVIYSPDSIIELVPSYSYINPFVGILKNIRASILYDSTPDFFFLWYNLVFSVVFFYLAILLFRRNEHMILEKL